jgi:hypothetical protein
MTRIGPWLLAGALGIAASTPGDPQPARDFDPMHGSLPRLELQPIYSRDRDDPWNLAFYLLFTREVRSQLAMPQTPVYGGLDERLRLRDRHVTRIEEGDRAVDPLYPSWSWVSGEFDVSPGGSWRLLRDPRFAQFTAALREMQWSASRRSPLARALMQSDLWAVYDLAYATTSFTSAYDHRADPAQLQQRRGELLTTLAATIRALALNRTEIASLPDNYAAGARAGILPDLFNPESGWVEIQWLQDRMHNHAVQFRRASRVFLRPLRKPPDEAAFLNSFRDETSTAVSELEAAALVTQNLLVADDGSVVPSPITFDVQIRRFGRDGHATSTQVAEHELSRRLLLTDPDSSGFTTFDGNDPSYLPMAGNDFLFATPRRPDAEPILVPLRDRCAACHGSGAGQLFTFSVARGPNWIPPPVQRLDPSANRHTQAVAAAESAREDFKSLQREWFANGR